MKFKNTKVYNFEGAFHGMRNPMNSWGRSDSFFGITNIYNTDILTDICEDWIQEENIGRIERGEEPYSHDMTYYQEYYDKLEKYEDWFTKNGILDCNEHGEIYSVALIGPNDMSLAQKLILAGPEHCKFMRQIFVNVDITAPLYWWQEFDTYKVGTVANSTSTMHKLATTPITIDCFEGDDYQGIYAIPDREDEKIICPTQIIEYCEYLRQKYLETKDKGYWKELIRWLPESWLQTRTVTMSYANLRNMYMQRQNHKLLEWHAFCAWVDTLPYSAKLITI